MIADDQRKIIWLFAPYFLNEIRLTRLADWPRRRSITLRHGAIAYVFTDSR